jgi:hypothetical protein
VSVLQYLRFFVFVTLRSLSTCSGVSGMSLLFRWSALEIFNSEGLLPSVEAAVRAVPPELDGLVGPYPF